MDDTTFLTIDGTQTIEEIQNQFNRIFPFLKIEFFNAPHAKGAGSEKKRMYVSNTKKQNPVHLVSKPGKISVNSNRSVQELETDFQKQFGLSVQVFRKSGTVWLETSATDDWTLEEQNEEGRSLQQPLKTEKENFNDHDIW